jgi:hypothetical protein
MKKFINILACLIVAMVAMSCGSKVEKDIKAIAGDEFKVCDVKTIDIKSEFYQYTNDYAVLENQVSSAISNLAKWKVHESIYNEGKDSLDAAQAKFDLLIEKENALIEKIQSGKLYIAKLKGKDKYTGKPLNFNSYQIFAYDSNGKLYPTESDEFMQMVCSVYPEVKKDIEKVLEQAKAAFIDAMADFDF